MASWDRLDICTAHAALENDWNLGGWLRQRPSNRRRMEATHVQLARLQYRSPCGPSSFADMLPDGTHDGFHDEYDNAREIYVHALVTFGLAPQVNPTDELGTYIRATYAADWVARHFPQFH